MFKKTLLTTVFFILYFIALCSTAAAQLPTPTLDYLATHDIEVIFQNYREMGTGEEFQQRQEFFNHVIDKETKGRFFAYHGSTQNFRIFQDILRGVFEETLGYKLPQDFYFMRIPGSKTYDFPRGKDSFYKMFDRRPEPRFLDALVREFLLSRYNRSFIDDLHIDQFGGEEREQLHKVFIDFVKYVDELRTSSYGVTAKTLTFSKKTAAADGDSATVDAGELLDHPIKDPVYLEDIAKNIAITKAKHHQIAVKGARGMIAKDLTPKYSPDLPLIAEILSKASGKDSDENRAALLSWLQKSLRADVLLDYFWEAIGNSDSSVEAEEKAQFLLPYLDTRPSQQIRVISMNIPLYGNYFRWDESTVNIFLENSSIEGGDSPAKNELKSLFAEIGLKKNLVDELYAQAVKILNSDKGGRYGCLYQFFDREQSAPYAAANRSAFVSFDFGVPVKSMKPGDLVQGITPLHTRSIDLQLRLVMSNQRTLNPFSDIAIVRYDLVAKKNSEKILSAIRARLKSAVKNKAKIKAYKVKVEKAWSKGVAAKSAS